MFPILLLIFFIKSVLLLNELCAYFHYVQKCSKQKIMKYLIKAINEKVSQVKNQSGKSKDKYIQKLM